jgi:hypothetical protein
MIPNPGQFIKKGSLPPSSGPRQLVLPGMETIRPNIRRPEDKDIPRRPEKNPHMPAIGPTPNDRAKEKRKIQPEDVHPRKKDYINKTPVDKQFPHTNDEYKKRHKEYESYKNKRQNTIKKKKDDDDDNKGGAGGAKVPRKPKPSPQSPGEYRPIERRVDQDYARRQDRYRVTLAR